MQFIFKIEQYKSKFVQIMKTIVAVSRSRWLVIRHKCARRGANRIWGAVRVAASLA